MMTSEKQYYQALIRQIKEKMKKDWTRFWASMQLSEEVQMLYWFLYWQVDVDSAASALEKELKELFSDRKKYPAFFKRILNRDSYIRTQQYIKQLGVQREYLKNVVEYYNEMKEYAFTDYEDAIIYLFFHSQGLTMDDLKQMKIADEYKRNACFALSYAGEPGELGRAYYGGLAIRENCQYLDESVLDALLQYNIDDGELANGVWYQIRYMIQMIIHSSLQEGDKSVYKFHYIDRYQLHIHLSHFFRKYFDGKYPHSVYRDSSRNESLVNKEAQGQSIQFAIDPETSGRWDEIAYIIVELNKISGLRVCLRQDTIRFQIGNKWSEELSFMLQEERMTYQEIERVCNNLLSVNVSREYLELLYLYVDNLYGKGRQYNLVFSHEYQYQYVSDGERRYIRIGQGCRRTPKGFFGSRGKGRGRIQNINALIGRNGSGKTSVAKLLTESEIFGIRDHEEENDYCVIFKIGNSLYWVSNIEDMGVTVSDADISLSRLGENFGQFQGIMNTAVVSYNNFLNPIHMEVFKQTVSRPVESVMRYRLTTPELLAQSIRGNTQTDILRIVNLYEDLAEKSKNLGIVERKEVYLYADIKACEAIDRCYQEACRKTEMRGWLSRELHSFFDYDLNENGNGSRRYAKLPMELYCKWYIASIIEKRHIYRPTDLSEKDRRAIKTHLMECVGNYQKLDCQYCADAMGERTGGRFYKWSISREKIIQCHKLFEEMLHSQEGFFFELPQMSTGECARLLLFARLHSVFHVRQEYSPYLPLSSEQRNFILVLDEIEAFFHPTWQREIVYDLIDFLEWESEAFDAYDNIHLILSSNAPFFLSDLPKDSLIYLDEEAVGPGQSYSSFGQNIHTILKNSFLLKDGLMGKFAQQKIEAAFAVLQKSEIAQESLEEVEYIIDELEEPIIKHALEELMERVREREMNSKERKLAKYKQQIAELQAKIDKLQNDKGMP